MTSSRIRTIKPEFFKHEALFDLEQETGLPVRLAFAGLWTQCDRAGRFAWRPRQLKTDILPYDDVDFSRVLDALATRGFVVKYASDGQEYGHIPSWNRHQVINNREKASDLPQPTDNNIISDACLTREQRVPDATRKLPSGREGKGRSTDASTTRDELPLNGHTPTPRSELLTVLDDTHAAAVIDHRQRMRKPLTPHAAKLLAEKFARAPNANAAADTMIANGWQGFEPEWLDRRKTGPPARAADLDPLGNPYERSDSSEPPGFG